MTIVRRASAARGGNARRGHRYEVLTAAQPGQRAELSRHTLAPGGSTGADGRPADARARQPRDRARRAGSRRARLRRRRATSSRGRLRDLRRRPAPPLREPDRARAPRLSSAGPVRRELQEELRCRRRCSTRSGRPTRWAARARPDLHRPAPRPRGHEPAGVRRAAPRRAARCAGPTARSPPPTTTRPPTARPWRRGSRTSSPACRCETLERNCEEFGIPVYSLGSTAPGHRARDRPRARRHPAGHDDRLRRLAHLDARRLRRARVRDRHQRGRARARDAVHGRSTRPRSMRILYDGELGFGVTRQGPDPRHARAPRRRRHDRPRRRVRRRADPGALDGGPHDRLQHDDRGRRRAPA